MSRPPMYKDCSCGHIGQQHRDDGTCMRCECTKFVHPTRRYAAKSSASTAVDTDKRSTKQKRMGARPKG